MFYNAAMKNSTSTAKNAWILITDGTNVFDTEVRTGAMQLAKELGFSHIRLVNEEELEAHYLDSKLFASGRVGVISHAHFPSILKAIRHHRIPAVLLGEESVTEWRKAIGGPVTVCSVDNRGIGQMAADYFFEQGRFASFAFADVAPSPFTSWWSDPRYTAFRKTLEEHGFTGEVPRIAVNLAAPNEDARRFADFIRKLPRPSAVFCCNDRIARDVFNFCEDARLHIPDDVAVLGVDNEAEVCESTPTGISSIKVEHIRLGRTAFRSLLHQLEGEPARNQDILCPPIRVIERGSTRRSTPTDRFVSKAVDYIASARLDALNAKSVIAASGASRSYLTKRFRNETGRTILEAIHLRFMNEVKRALSETDKPIALIAEETGFSSASGLCSLFHRKFGISMSAFRDQMRMKRVI